MSIPPVLLAHVALVITLCAIGAFVCGRYAFARKNLGMGLFSIYFAAQIVSSIMRMVAQMGMLASFEQRQTGPNTWTAPVVEIDFGPVLSIAFLLIACRLVGRSLSDSSPRDTVSRS